MRKLLVVGLMVVVAATIGGYMTSGSGATSAPTAAPAPPPLNWDEQASLPVAGENGPLVCGGKLVTVGYVREHVLKIEPLPPPPSEQDRSRPQETGMYYFRCVDDEVVAVRD